MAPTLLLADDNSTIQRLVEMTFAEHGIKVISVSNGQEAIDHLTVRRPDIALVGVRLETRDGYDVAEYVQREPLLRGLPILLVAGAFDTVDEARVRESGAVGVLFKPFESTQVINRVKELLGLSAKDTDQTAGERVAPQPGRLLTSSEGPAHRDSMAAPAEEPASRAADTHGVAAGAPVPSQPAQPGTAARESAAPQEPDAGGESYFGHLDEAFDALDAQVARHSAPADRAVDAVTSPPHHPLPDAEAGQRQPYIGATDSSVRSAPEPTARADSYAASPRYAQGVGGLSGRMAGGNPGFTVDDDWLPRSGARETGSAPAVSPAMADAFALILAQEQGERMPEHEEAPREQTVYRAPIELSDDVIDRIAQRVADRLIAGPLGERVTRAANDVSERLVREEIARIRASASQKNT